MPSSGRFAYRVAEATLVSDYPIELLSPFRGGSATVSSRDPNPFELQDEADPGEETFSGTAWIARRMRSTRATYSGRAYRLSIEGAGHWMIAADGSRIELVAELEEGSRIWEETLLGPVLALALASKGVFVLHASSVLAAGGQLVAFAGPSGTGKSTLARLVSESSQAAIWTLASDDALPIQCSGGVVEALIRFPQLKLELENQPGLALPERLGLSAVFRLVPDNSASANCVTECQTLSPSAAAKVLLSHTIGSRLFSRDLMIDHMKVMAGVARGLRVCDLSFPRTPWAGAKVGELVKRQLSGNLEEVG